MCRTGRVKSPAFLFVRPVLHPSSSLSRLLALCSLGALVVLLGCQSEPPAKQSAASPAVRLREAPLLQLRGAQSPSPDKPGDCDCNNPAHWEGETLFVFNSTGHPWRSSGADLFHLDQGYWRCEYDNQANGGRWIECTWKAENGVLYDRVQPGPGQSVGLVAAAKDSCCPRQGSLVPASHWPRQGPMRDRQGRQPNGPTFRARPVALGDSVLEARSTALSRRGQRELPGSLTQIKWGVYPT